MESSFGKLNPAELNSPILLFLWAAWFLLFDSLASSKSYEMFVFLSNFEWAFIFAAVGVFKAFALAFGGIRLNFAAIFFALVLWLVSFVLFTLSNYQSHAVPMSFYCAYINFLRLKEAYQALKN